MSTASDTIDDDASADAPRASLGLRLKRLLVVPLLMLRRLRGAKAGGKDGAMDAAEEDEGEAARPPLWRRLLPFGAVLLAGLAAGGGGAYWLSAGALAHQAAQLAEQQAETQRLKGVVAGYDGLMLQTRKKLEEEQSRRVAAENRLAMAQADLTRQPPAGTGRPASPATGRDGGGKSLDCTLQPGSAGSSLKACLKEFNGR